jgi:DNA/RNA endonuclease G (NUC1)
MTKRPPGRTEASPIIPAGHPRPAPSRPVDVFISYSRRDHAIAGKLRELLEYEGWDVWWDQDLYAGATWEEMLLDELAKCKAVVVLWSQHAVKSRWVLQEAHSALSEGKLVPCALDASRPPPPYDTLQFARLTGWTGGSEHPELPRLFDGLTQHATPSRIDLVRPGFDTEFLGAEIGLPVIPGVGDEFPYLHFSVIMNPGRRLAWYVAYGIEPQGFVPERPFRWSPDPTLSRQFQPVDEHFRGTGFDRGHLAAPMSVAWGEQRQAIIAIRQAFYWTNTSPQAPQVNRRSWASLEDFERLMARESGRVAGFSGPVLDIDDPLHVVTDELRGRLHSRQTFRLPRRYWKVVIWRSGRLLQSACFDVPNIDDPALPQRRSLREIEDLTGLEFSPSVHEATPAAQVRVALA